MAFADRRQADVEPLWSERSGRYVPAVALMDTRLNANMLSVRASRAGGRLRALVLTADHGGYTATFLRLPANARLRVIACACQRSTPHTRRVAQTSFTLREQRTQTVTVRLTPR
jgi:hypothetical protein